MIINEKSGLVVNFAQLKLTGLATFVGVVYLPLPDKIQQELLENFEIEEHREWVVRRSCNCNI